MDRVFGFKMIDAPWMGEGQMVRRIDLKDALRKMGRSGTLVSDGVYWSSTGNSYIMVDGTHYWHPEMDCLVDVVSVNGCGEIRWQARPWWVRGVICYTSGDRAALIAFGLIDKEE